MSNRRQQPDAPKSLDRSWHLARTPEEMNVAGIEYALIRCFEAFGHWQAECLASVAEFSASGPENALLHMIRANDRPKSVRDLAHMANRQDVPNIQYSLRKLIKGGLVAKTVMSLVCASRQAAQVMVSSTLPWKLVSPP